MELKRINLKEKDFDFFAVHMGIGYIVIPILIFLLGFLRFYIAIPFAAAVIYCWCKAHDSIYRADGMPKTEGKPYLWILLFVLVAVWVYFSGIGSFSFQNSDYIVRNPIFRDLINYKWPVIYDLSEMPERITSLTGKDEVMFVYYFAYWLPSALVGKLFGEAAANVALYLWTVLGIVLVIYFMARYTKKLSYHVVLVLMFFGGLDIVGNLLLKGSYTVREHIEWWTGHYQYSGNTTQLYWVFNQAVPTWLITLLLMNCHNRKSVIFIASSVFCYSPFTTLGMIPIAIYAYLRRYESDEGKSVKEIVIDGLTLQNCFMPVMMFVVFGFLYLANSGSVGVKGWLFAFDKDRTFGEKLINHILFFIVEVGVYFFALRGQIKKNGFLLVSFISLLLIPFYKITPANDFAMRASIPALFILMVFVMQYVQMQTKKTLITVLLVISSLTAISEIDRSVYNTIHNEEYLQESIYSLGDMQTDSDYWIHTCSRQFFARNYEDSAFYKYLAKHGKGN